MAITTKDLARICGVSRATITRALNDTGRINAETKNRILETVKELGYQPDLLARSLVKGKTMTIGVIVVDLKNQYFPEMINAMENRVKEEDYLLNITLHEDNKETEKQLIRALVGHRVDGLMISPANKGREFIEFLSQLPIPVVMLGNKVGHLISSVGIDEFRAAKEATEYILSKGYQNIAFVVPPLSDKEGLENGGHEQRLEGFEEAIKGHKIETKIIYGKDYTEQVNQYMEKSVQKPAFLCSGDMFAGNVMDKLSKNGYRVITDYGVMGFDCIDMFRQWSPRLTTIDNHIGAIGYEAADLLFKMISKKCDTKELEIPFNIVEGDTL